MVAVALTVDEVARLASLARIDLTESELATLAPQLDVIVDAVAGVAGVAKADISPMSHALPLTNAFREDVVTACLPREDALAMAPAVEDDRFRVPRILSEEA